MGYTEGRQGVGSRRDRAGERRRYGATRVVAAAGPRRVRIVRERSVMSEWWRWWSLCTCSSPKGGACGDSTTMGLARVYGPVEFILALNLLHVFAFFVGFHTALNAP